MRSNLPVTFGLVERSARRLRLAATAVIAACAGGDPPPVDTALVNAAVCDTASARAVVERFGDRLRGVSLLGPDTAVQRQIREAYTPYVTPGLLDVWVARPESAPGRKVSSPWPERIAIDTIAPAGLRTCRVVAHVIYATSVSQTEGGDSLRERVVLRITGDSAWRIDTYVARPN